ncbi:MAG: hypothetical protein KME11_12350 [Timaviella obliquedivisa GSE-PSE-MK23-08B]|nr:hypothetical protein [Timaviella obliquedivisa GSE-PSE-MK23-08B]
MTHNHIVLSNNRIAGSAIQMLSGNNGIGACAIASAGLRHRYTVAPEALPTSPRRSCTYHWQTGLE